MKTAVKVDSIVKGDTPTDGGLSPLEIQTMVIFSYKNITNAGQRQKKSIGITLTATGAIAAAILGQLEGIEVFVTRQGIFWCFMLLFCSSVLGVLALMVDSIRETAAASFADVQTNVLFDEFQDIGELEKSQIRMAFRRIFEGLPFIYRLAGFWLARKKNIPMIPYQLSAYWASVELCLLSLQQVVLVLTILPVLLFMK